MPKKANAVAGSVSEAEVRSQAASDPPVAITSDHELQTRSSVEGEEEIDVDKPVAEERSKALKLLQSMFGDAEEWGGKEPINSDEEEVQEVAVPATLLPKEKPGKKSRDAKPKQGIEMEPETQETDEPAEETQKTGSQVSKTSLKDMFKPQEAEAGFSLFNDLDLDLDLDPSMVDIFQGVEPAENPQNLTSLHAHVPTITPVLAAGTRREVVTLDPTLPFFFPYPENPLKNIADVLDSMVTQKFYRTETSDEIRKKWNEQKGELTREWKKRHREALKARRLRGGGKDTV